MSGESGTPIILNPTTPAKIGEGQDEPSGVLDLSGYGPQPDQRGPSILGVDPIVSGVTFEAKEDAERRLNDDNVRRDAARNERDAALEEADHAPATAE